LKASIALRHGLSLQLGGVDGLGAHRGRGDGERGAGAHGRGAAVLVPLDGAELRNLLGGQLSSSPVHVGREGRAAIVVLEDRSVVRGDCHRDCVGASSTGGSGCALGTLGTRLALGTLRSGVALRTGSTSEREAAAEALGDGHISAIYRDGNKHVARLRHRAGRRDGYCLAVGALGRAHASRTRDVANGEADLAAALKAHDLRGAVAGLGRTGGAEESISLAREDDAVRISYVDNRDLVRCLYCHFYSLLNQ